MIAIPQRTGGKGRIESAEAAPMRVLHLVRRITHADVVDNLIRFLDRARFQPIVCTFEPSPVREEYEELGIRVHCLDLGRRGQYPRGVAELCRIVRGERVQLIHTHHFDEALLGAAAGRLTRTRVVLGRHYYDEVYLLNAPKRRAVIAVEQLANRAASRVLVPTQKIRTLLHDRQQIDAEKIRVVPYGFDFSLQRYQTPTVDEIAEVRERLGVPEGFLVAGFGRHYWSKGHADLIRGFASFRQSYPDARLVLVGDGPQHAQLRELAGQLGLNTPDESSVVFTGWWPGDVAQIIGAADVVVHPTYSEAFSLLVVETLALGTPLIVTNAGIADEHFEHGDTVFTVPVRDPDAIARALTWVRQHPLEVNRMRQRAQRYVREALDIRARARQYEDCYMELVRAE